MTTHFGLFRPAHTFANLAVVAFFLALLVILLCAAPADGQVTAASLASQIQEVKVPAAP